MKTLLIRHLTMVGLLAGLVFPAMAGDVVWTGAAGSYLDATQWSTAALPGEADYAKLGSSAVVTFAGGEDAQIVTGIHIGYVEGDPLAAQFLFNSGNLTAKDYFLLGQAKGSAGSVTQIGGALTVNGVHDPSFSVGYAEDADGTALSTYTLSDGTITVVGNTHVATRGRGSFIQTGGEFSVDGWFVMGWGGGIGTYDLSGGILHEINAGRGVIIGENGAGTMPVRDSGKLISEGRISLNGNGSLTVKDGGRVETSYLTRQNNVGETPSFTFDNGTLAMIGSTLVRNPFFPAFANAAIGDGGMTLEIPENAQATVPQAFSGTGGLTKTGKGTLTLTGENTYTGTTRVREGALFLAGPTTITSLDNLTFDSGATIGICSDQGWSLTDLGTIAGRIDTVPNVGLGIDTSAQDLTFSGDLALSNGGGLLKAGGNTLTLTGSNTYTGDTRIEGGTLAAADGTSLPSASHITFAGGAWAPMAGTTSRALGTGAGEVSFTPGLAGGFSAVGAPLTVNLGGNGDTLVYGSANFDPSTLLLNPAGADNPLTLSNPIDIGAKALTIDIASSDAGAPVTLAGGVSGAQHLTKSGAGSLVIDGPFTLPSHWLVLTGGKTTLSNPDAAYGPVHDIRVDTGSQLTIAGNATINMTAWFYAGIDGKDTGVMMENGTLNNSEGRLIVAQNKNSTGSFTLQDGTITSRHLIIGNRGTGTFIQNGGTVTDVSGDGDAVIGEYDNDDSVTGKGIYQMNGGTLTVNDNFQVGARGEGDLLQSAGDVSCTGWFVVGRFGPGVGTYNMTGGTYTSTANPAIIGEDGLGTLDISGTGILNAPGLRLGSNAGGTGNVRIHDGGTLNVGQIIKGAGKMSLSFDDALVKVRGDNATIQDFMSNLSGVSVGDGGLALDVGNNNVSVADFGLAGKSGGTITKTGSGSLMVESLPAVRKMAVEEGTLVLAGDPVKPTLAHRWSFNNSYTDSVTGTDATPVGSVTLTEKDAQLLGGGKGTSYIDLGQNVMPSDSITIEIWSTLRSHRTWEKMFSFGSSTENGFLFTYSTGSAGNASSINAVANGSANTTGTGYFDDNVPYYLGITVMPNGNGGSTLRAYRKDVTTGATLGTIVSTVSNWTIHQIVQNDCWLGNTWWNDSNPSANYDEVRIWNGVFSEAEMTSHVLLGTETLPSEKDEAEGNVYPEAASETLLANNYLLHRWTFNGNPEDGVGNNTAVFNGKVVYTNGNTAARLEGGGKGTSWIDLGKGIIPTDDTPFTIEMWLTARQHRNWAKAFSFGSGTSSQGTSGIIFTLKTGNSAATSAVNLIGSGSGDATGTGNFVENVEYQLAITINPDGNGGSTVNAYVYNAFTGEKLGSYNRTFPAWTPSMIDLQDCWLGRTWWGDNDPSATYNEVRIWNAALSEAQIIANNKLGPDALPTLTAASTLNTADCLDVAANAAIDLSGYTLAQSVVSGSGEIRNGTLTVTQALIPGGDGTVGTLTLNTGVAVAGAVKLDVGDLIAASGALDLTKATISLANPAALSGGYLFATSENGGIVGPVAGTNFTGSGYGIIISSDAKRAMIAPLGTCIIIR